MAHIKTKKEFGEMTTAFWKNIQKKPYAFGIGENYFDRTGELIAVRWLTINVESNYGMLAVLLKHVKYFDDPKSEYTLTTTDASSILEKNFQAFRKDDDFHANLEALSQDSVNSFTIRIYMDESELGKDTESIADVHFRLALMSRQHKLPNSVSLKGMWPMLPNLIWTNLAVYTIADWHQTWMSSPDYGEFALAQDKMPPMYWANPAPANVRVANTTMIRHGAHLAPETTVMHYGFVNFNAGTLGKSMVEGRISAGTTVGARSDIGAGAGFLGTLSGGNDIVINTGENCLVGAMAECGIPIGDDVCIAAGVVFTGNTPVKVIRWKKRSDGKFETDANGRPLVESERVCKAIELEGICEVTFRRNSLDGSIEVIPVPNKAVLNDMLHKND